MEQDIKCKTKERKIEKNEEVGMQMHPAHSPNIVIPRTFRWTLTNETHADIHWWMQSIKTDYVSKKLYIEIFDDAKGVVFNWLQSLIANEKEATDATLTHLDGYGKAISIINFTGLRVEEHNTLYNYGSSEVLTHKVVLSYTRIKRTNQLNVN